MLKWQLTAIICIMTLLLVLIFSIEIVTLGSRWEHHDRMVCEVDNGYEIQLYCCILLYNFVVIMSSWNVYVCIKFHKHRISRWAFATPNNKTVSGCIEHYETSQNCVGSILSHWHFTLYIVYEITDWWTVINAEVRSRLTVGHQETNILPGKCFHNLHNCIWSASNLHLILD